MLTKCDTCGKFLNRPPCEIIPRTHHYCADCIKCNEIKFWSKVEKTNGCWLWKGAIGKNGYCETRFNNRRVSAHRLSWILANGNIPNGLYVCHKCDIKHCVNPKHLFLGTQKDNIQDAVNKGRIAIGERVANSFLTPEDVLMIRSLHNQGVSKWIISRTYNIHPEYICKIANKKVWKHI